VSPLAVALALCAHWLFGAGYVAWWSNRTVKDLSPMGLLRLIDKRAGTSPEISMLPVPVIVGIVAAVYVAVLTFWPFFALRRLAIHLGIVKGA